jgi:hypothetical protein
MRSTLKSVDGLGAVHTRKRPDFWCQILTYSRLGKQKCNSKTAEAQGVYLEDAIFIGMSTSLVQVRPLLFMASIHGKFFEIIV